MPTYSPNLGITLPILGETGWGVTMDSNLSLLDSQNAIGDMAVQTAEVPSASLNVAVSSGVVIAQDGSTVTYAGTSSQAVSASSTKVIFLDGTASWALTVGASYPATPHVKIATVVTGSSTITSITDNRQTFNVAGSIADGANFTFGTTTGTEIGTGATQKIGFYGASPIVQPTFGSSTAGSSYTSHEQGMIQTLWNAVRALGLGS